MLDASCVFTFQVVADARLLSLKTTTFGCEEGSLTGERVAVFKSLEAVAADSTIAVRKQSYLCTEIDPPTEEVVYASVRRLLPYDKGAHSCFRGVLSSH